MHSVSPQAYFPATRPHIPKNQLVVVLVNGTTAHKLIIRQAEISTFHECLLCKQPTKPHFSSYDVVHMIGKTVHYEYCPVTHWGKDGILLLIN